VVGASLQRPVQAPYLKGAYAKGGGGAAALLAPATCKSTARGVFRQSPCAGLRCQSFMRQGRLAPNPNVACSLLRHPRVMSAWKGREQQLTGSTRWAALSGTRATIPLGKMQSRTNKAKHAEVVMEVTHPSQLVLELLQDCGAARLRVAAVSIRMKLKQHAVGVHMAVAERGATG
jgi:hypothetical protein